MSDVTNILVVGTGGQGVMTATEIDATEVIVRDQPMDLKAVSRENVARFEVK